MIGKVPNKANAPKKVLIRVIIVLLVWAALLAFNLFNKLSDEGLRWTIPREVQDKVDFDKLEDNIDKLRADGYWDGWGERELCFTENPGEEWSTEPFITVQWYTDAEGERVSIAYAHSQFHSWPWPSSGYRFAHSLVISSGDASLTMRLQSPHYFSGRQKLVESLDEFCDKYCS